MVVPLFTILKKVSMKENIPLIFGSGILGFGIIIVIIIITKSGTSFIDAFTVGIFLWNILPHFLYFLFTFKIRSLLVLVIPAILILGIQIYEIINMFQSTNSTASLSLLVIPIEVLVAMGIGFLIGYIVHELTKPIKRDQSI
jgi:hypothetical protein